MNYTQIELRRVLNQAVIDNVLCIDIPCGRDNWNVTCSDNIHTFGNREYKLKCHAWKYLKIVELLKGDT